MKGEEKGINKMSTYNGFEWVLNFILRGISGMLLIYFGNRFLRENMPDCLVGYNLLTFFVCGFLGVPGVCLLYGILFFKMLI